MAATVKRSKRFRKFAFGIALAGTLACAACAFAAPPPITAFAERGEELLGSLLTPATEESVLTTAGTEPTPESTAPADGDASTDGDPSAADSQETELFTIEFNENTPTKTGNRVQGEMEPMTMPYGETRNLPANEYSLVGYTFKGWKTVDSDDNTYDYGDEDNIASPETQDEGDTLTLYANWVPIKYSILYQNSKPHNASTTVAGTVQPAESHFYDTDPYHLTANPYSLPGYKFTGWNTEADGTGISYSNGQTVSNLTATNLATINLYAQWDPLEYTLDFRSNGGNGSMDSIEIRFDETYQLPSCTFYREGCTFSHWSISDSEERFYGDGSFVKNLCGLPTDDNLLNSVTLTANWVENEETTVIVRLNNAPDTSLSQNDVSLKASDGTITCADSASNGTFVFPDISGNDSYSIMVKGDDTGKTTQAGTTVALDYYSVEIKLDSLSDVANVSKVWIGDKNTTKLDRVLAGTTVPIGAIPNDSYVFDNYTSTGVDPKWDPDPYTAMQDIVINGKVTITAWARGAVYTVHFDPNVPAGASTAAQFKGTMSDQTTVYGTNSKPFENQFNLPGYAFSGWITKVNGAEFKFGINENLDKYGHDFPIEDGETIVFYAQWTPNIYGINYLPAEGSTSVSSGPITFDSEFTLASPSALGFITPPDGKTFLGWSLDDRIYSPGEIVRNLCYFNSYGSPAGFELTATWVDGDYTVFFIANGGTGTMESQPMKQDEPQSLFSNVFSRPGHTFTGWNTEPDGTGTSYSDKESVTNLPAENKEFTLYAQWRRIPPPPPPPSTNDVESKTTGHGNVAIDPQNAKPGEMVTVIAQPDEGYGVFSIEVLDSSDNQVPLTYNGDGTYSFAMPEDDVTVKTTFKVILPFSDLDWHHWAYDDIVLVYERGLMTGYESGEFGADDVTTRAMAVTVIWRLAGCPQTSADMPFTDVADGQWYTEAVRWAAEAGITVGYEGSGLFGPEDNLTREQVVAFLMRYAETEGMDTSERSDLSSFPDKDAVSEWAKEAVEWAVAEGLLRGNGNTGALDSQEGGTRAALAALTVRYDAMLPTEPVS